MQQGKTNDSSTFQQIITDNFVFIEKQCFSVVKLRLRGQTQENQLNIENEALELSNRVLDLLKKNDFRILRDFQEKCKLTTYLCAIISRQAIDMIRRKLGRSREKERAKLLGEAGLLVYERIFKDKYSPAEVLDELNSTKHSCTLEELEEIVKKIKGPNKIENTENDSIIRTGKVTVKEEVVVVDNKSDPQQITMDNMQREKTREVINDILHQLSGEERLILRMRYPAGEGEEPKPVQFIADTLSISQKAVYKRITRIMKKCKQRANERGVSFNDLF